MSECVCVRACVRACVRVCVNMTEVCTSSSGDMSESEKSKSRQT